MPTFLETFKAARKVSTPLIFVRTADYAATIANIVNDRTHGESPMILWDIVNGVVGCNDPRGRNVAKSLITGSGEDANRLEDPLDMLKKIAPKNAIPAGTVVFMANLNRYFHDSRVVQAVWNLRDKFKEDTRTLVMVGPAITLPPELAQDVLVLDEPLPDAAQLAGIVGETYLAANLIKAEEKPKAEVVERAVEALSGLAAFPAEQVCAMSITKAGLDIEALWERKRQQIEQTPGLSIWRGKDSFSSVIGLGNCKGFHLRRGQGPLRRRAVVFIDEIDKHMANFGAVGTGDTTTEMIGALLTDMEETEAEGSAFLGVAGSGKTLLAKAIANEWQVPLIFFDLAGMKGSLVGQSGENIRTALKVVHAVSQGQVYYIATCNRFDSLPPEMRRRFRSGTFFFDLPTKPEKEAAWNLYEAKWNVKGKRPDDTGWTPAEIRNCCYNAHVLSTSIEEAAKYIVPVSISSRDKLDDLRRQADQKFISASYSGLYHVPEGLEPEPQVEIVGVVAAVKGRRKIDPSGSGGSTPKGQVN
jgi:hypothetical protein